jgi:hypothetical protein
MTVLAVNKPVEQAKPVLLVENRLAAGRHRFSLVVVNDRGVASEAMTLLVTVGRGILRGPVGRLDPPLVGERIRRRAPPQGPSR